MIQISATDFDRKLVQLSSGEVLPITGMFDVRGLPTDDGKQAVLALISVAPTISLKLAAYDPRKLQ